MVEKCKSMASDLELRILGGLIWYVVPSKQSWHFRYFHKSLALKLFPFFFLLFFEFGQFGLVRLESFGYPTRQAQAPYSAG